MANGEAVNERLEFKERMDAMPLEARTTETALMVYDLGIKFNDCIAGNGASKKASAATGGTVAAILVGIWEAAKLIFSKG